MMIPHPTNFDEHTAAMLLWELKAIATKEVEHVGIPHSCIDSFFMDRKNSLETRRRTISFESADVVVRNNTPPVIPQIHTGIVERSPFLLDNPVDGLDHHNWGPTRDPKLPRPSLIDVDEAPKKSKRKRESHVGLTTKSGIIRSTLRKKFSWKQYPELEDYLLRNQDEYFEYSSRNYTAEQRKYNNGLTRGLLDLASEEGYVFEEFTFSMVRDRIRCYYKSHSQSAKKKRRR